jgi:all-trans-retinol 13,14-reductase
MTSTPAYIGEHNLAKNKYSRPKTLLRNPDAIIIGSGIGGLGLASILAQRKKWRVLVLEGAPTPGGSLRCHEWDGYEFNSGIDSIGDMDPSVGRGTFRPTIDYITGGKLQWAKMCDMHEVSTFGPDEYPWYSHHERNIAWIEERLGEGAAARRYYELEERLEKSATFWGATKVWPEWMPVKARELVYQKTAGLWRTYMERKTHDVFVNELGFSEKLAAIFSYMYGNHGRTPARSPFAFHAMNLNHFRYGAYYPVGGPAQMVECIVPIIEAAGGQVAVSCKVERIVVKDDKAVGVELATGETINAPVVISAAGAYNTFMEMLDRPVAERHGFPEKFKQIGPSVAHLFLFLGYDEAIDIPQHIAWHMPSYDIEGFDKGYKQDLDFEHCMGGYMLSPSARDPVYAQRFPNKSTVIILNEAPHEWVERCRIDPPFRDKMEADIIRYLEPIVLRHYPILQGKKPAFRRAGMPFGCNPYAWKGCSLGVDCGGDRFLEHTHWLRPHTPVKNLFLSGQDSFGPGFGSSLFSGRLTYAAMFNNYPFLLRKGVGSFP